MDDDWNYSTDIPMVSLNSLTREATNEWKVVEGKKANKSAIIRTPSACTGCTRHINQGRYGPLTDNTYDLDYDLPMLVLDLVKGDVPPAGELGDSATASPSPQKSLSSIASLYPSKGAEAVKKSMDSLHRKYKEVNSKRVPISFAQVFPLDAALEGKGG